MNGRSLTKKDLRSGRVSRYAPAPPPPPPVPWCGEGYIRDELGVLVAKRHVTSEAEWNALLPRGRR